MPPLTRRSVNCKKTRELPSVGLEVCSSSVASTPPTSPAMLSDGAMEKFQPVDSFFTRTPSNAGISLQLPLTSTPHIKKTVLFHGSFDESADSILACADMEQLESAQKGSPVGAATGSTPSAAAESICHPPSTAKKSMVSSTKEKLRENGRFRRPTVESLGAIARDAKMDRAAAELKEQAVSAVRQRPISGEILRAAAGVPEAELFYGLPPRVAQLLKEHRGIEKLYDWQDECLRLEAVQRRQNFIYALPTSGGKTLVAELLALHELLVRSKDVLFILPFVAIVQEKVKSLSAFALDLDFLVVEYAGSKGAFPPRLRRKYRSLYVATIEKASSLVNSLLELGRLDHLGMVVVDELHMIGEGGSRGAILEMTLAKLLHCAEQTQLIGMSATITNIKDLQTFMKAEVYSNDFRPVALEECVKMENNIFRVDPKMRELDEKLTHQRFVTFPYTKYMLSRDPDHLLGLVSEVIPEYSCLVFCPTKKNCENVAELLCSMMDRTLTETKKMERTILLTELKENCSTLCGILARTIKFGIAYHHSGLTTDERRLIEEAYSDGTLCLLACTSTLAAGVNLPAKRVILRSPYVGMQLMSNSQYKQMIGRAGRAGIDSTGESILIIKSRDRAKLETLLCGTADSCTSSLYYNDGKGFRRFILALIGLKICSDVAGVLAVVRHTLLAVQASRLGIDLVEATRSSLQRLVDSELVTQKRCRCEGAQVDDKDYNMAACGGTDPSGEDDTDSGAASTLRLDVTELGRAACKGCVDIDISQQLYKDLCKAQESLCLANYLHLLYLVTPYEMVEQVNPNWQLYLKLFGQLDATEQKVATIVGIEESNLMRRVAGQKMRKDANEYVIRRFYVTLMLYALWQKSSIWSVADKFQEDRGKVQTLLQSASTFAVCVHHFSQELQQLWAYQELFSTFVKKLSFCTSSELMPLMEIPGMKIGRAKQLYNFGLKTLQHVAYSNPETLVRNIEHMPHKAAKQIISSAMMLMHEKAESLREEAEDVISVPQD